MAPGTRLSMQLLFLALVLTSASAFRWGSIFAAPPDIAEASAKQLERSGHTHDNGQHGGHHFDHHASNHLKSTIPWLEKPLSEEPDSIRALLEADKHGSNAPKHDADRSAAASLSSASHSAGRESGIEELNMTAVERAFRDIQKEIDEMSLPLGPRPPSAAASSPEKNASERTSVPTVEHNKESNAINASAAIGIASNDQSLPPAPGADLEGKNPILREDVQQALAKSIEQAISGLTAVYGLLRTEESSTNPSVAAAGEAPSGFPVSATRAGNGVLLKGTAASNGGSDGSGTTSTGKADGNATTDGGDEDDKLDESAATGVTTLAALAGIVFVAAVGMMIVGFVQNQSGGAPQHSPLYPPRGPAFV